MTLKMLLDVCCPETIIHLLFADNVSINGTARSLSQLLAGDRLSLKVKQIEVRNFEFKAYMEG